MCDSRCHGCRALHRKAGRVAPRDNHSQAKGHLLRVDARVENSLSLLNRYLILPESNLYQTLQGRKSVQIKGKARQKHARCLVQVLTNTYVRCLFAVPD